MAGVRCPYKGCAYETTISKSSYEGTIQCNACANIIRVKIVDGIVVDAKARELDFEIPSSIPDELKSILIQAVDCFAVGSPAAVVVLCGLYIEGLLKQARSDPDRDKDNLADIIKEAHEEKRISRIGYHAAELARIIRNLGAHYSTDLAGITESDARIALELAGKLTTDILLDIT
jgi:hypothetical protein